MYRLPLLLLLGSGCPTADNPDLGADLSVADLDGMSDLTVADLTEANWVPYSNLTGDPAAVGAARVPHIAVAPNEAAHLIWYDTRHSNATVGPKVELYYARPGG